MIRPYRFLIRAFGMSAAALVALAGCESLLPRSDAATESTWASFEEARAAFDRIMPGTTLVKDLAALGFSTTSNPNVTVLNNFDLMRRFVPPSGVAADALDAKLAACFGVRERCSGLEVVIAQTHNERRGSFWLDFLNFLRTTETTGWRFNAVIVLSDDLVIYKLWGGTPQLKEVSTQRNPLGPLQGAGEKSLSVK